MISKHFSEYKQLLIDYFWDLELELKIDLFFAYLFSLILAVIGSKHGSHSTYFYMQTIFPLRKAALQTSQNLSAEHICLLIEIFIRNVIDRLSEQRLQIGQHIRNASRIACISKS